MCLSSVLTKQTHIMIAEDPRVRIGSGGATLNALLVVTEFMSALNGHTVVTPESIQDAHILIMHMVRAHGTPTVPSLVSNI